MPEVSIGDAELYYESHGEGPPLILVTGLGGFASFWAPHVPEFARNFRVITFDHRGIGGSTKSRIRYSVEQMADDVVKLMDALDEHDDVTNVSTNCDLPDELIAEMK